VLEFGLLGFKIPELGKSVFEFLRFDAVSSVVDFPIDISDFQSLGAEVEIYCCIRE
jgi:hypothetical protein